MESVSLESCQVLIDDLHTVRHISNLMDALQINLADTSYILVKCQSLIMSLVLIYVMSLFVYIFQLQDALYYYLPQHCEAVWEPSYKNDFRLGIYFINR